MKLSERINKARGGGWIDEKGNQCVKSDTRLEEIAIILDELEERIEKLEQINKEFNLSALKLQEKIYPTVKLSTKGEFFGALDKKE